MTWLLGFLTTVALRQFASAIAVDPVREIRDVKPGDSITGTFQVTNTDSQGTTFRIVTAPWYVLPENQKWPVDQWLKVKPKKFRLKPGQTQPVAYRITAPMQAKGELAAMIKFVPEPKRQEGQVSVSIIFNVSLYARLSGTEKVEADLGKAAVAAGRSDPTQPLQMAATLEVHNKGNIHIRPAGKVRIMRGTEEAATWSLKAGWPTFPGSLHRYATDPQPLLPPGEYRATYTVEIERLAPLTKRIRFQVSNDQTVGETTEE